MRLYAPGYYKAFACIADRCRHSCCIGWEIDIDRDSMKKYTASSGGYWDKVRMSIEGGQPPRFKTGEDGRCTHLDKRGLCRIITELGEGSLCEICREHPRFYMSAGGRSWVGLGMACEEACRIILSSDRYGELSPIGEAENCQSSAEFDTLPDINRIYSLLSDRAVPLAVRLSAISNAFSVSTDCLTDGEWRELISALEYLDGQSGARFSAYSSVIEPSEALEAALERAFAYFVYRHCTEAENEAELRMGLGFALFAVGLLSSVAAAEGVTDISSLSELARLLSEELEYSEDNTEQIKTAFL